MPPSAEDDFLLEDDQRQEMFFHLLKKFEVIDGILLIKQFNLWSSSDLDVGFGDFLKKEGLLDQDQYVLLSQIQTFLYTRYADKQFAEMLLETGHVSRDEIDYSLKGQEEIFKSDRKVKKIGDLLIEYGSISEELKRELLVQQGRSLD